MRPKAIDLFCGAGGMSLGFEQAGFDVVLAVDVDGHHVAVHQRNFPSHPALGASATDLTAEKVWQAIGGKTEIELVCGGPPCQGFSTMGLRDPLDSRNSLIGHFVRLVSEIRPKAFVMENVPGMAVGQAKPVLDRAILALEQAGYTITKPVQVLDASLYGVPQKRRRLFLLGARGDLGVTLSYPLGPPSGQPPRPTVWEAISDLPAIEGQDGLFKSDEARYDKEPAAPYAKVARGIVLDPTDFSHPRLASKDICTGCLRIRHVASAVELYRATPPGSVVPGHKLPRLDPDGVCPTLRAGSDSSHGSYTAPRPVHPVQPRCITAREAARLHGFPDWFAFYPTKWHAYRQIGNAVCPPVARAVGLSILGSLGLDPVKPTVPVNAPDGFVLADDRPRTQKRIPHVKNYAPVVAALFASAFDPASKSLRRARFTFADVQTAISAVDASLPWTRADTFVQELARSRSVRRLLASCLEQGYAIRPLREGDDIGEFVTEGTPGAITDKDAIEVKSRDLAGAVALDLLVAPGRLADLLDDPRVATRPSGFVVVAEASPLPTRSKIKKIAESANSAEVVLIARLTVDHVAVIQFGDCLRSPVERCRRVFRVGISDRVEKTLFGDVLLPPLSRRRRPSA